MLEECNHVNLVLVLTLGWSGGLLLELVAVKNWFYRLSYFLFVFYETLSILLFLSEQHREMMM